MPPIRLVRFAAVLGVITVTGLAGCGRRGNLEPDPESGINARQAREATKVREQNQTERLEVNHRLRNVVPPKDPFILDPLL